MNVKKLDVLDLITVVYHNDRRFYRLSDIAVWKVDKTIKTIQMTEAKLDWSIREPKEKKKAYQKLIKESVHKFKHGERFIVYANAFFDNPTMYQINIRHGWKNPKIIGSISFNKMVTT